MVSREASSLEDEHRPWVLVVNDDHASRYASVRWLRTAGLEVQEAASGAEALPLIAKLPDVVVLDIHLPDTSGLELCQKIRADQRTERLPVLLMTAKYTRLEDEVLGLESGADGYLTQPVEPTKLIATVRSLVRMRRAELRSSYETRLRATLIDNVPAALFLLDDRRLITFANPAASRLLGWSLGQLRGRSWDSLLAHPCSIESDRGTPIAEEAEVSASDFVLRANPSPSGVNAVDALLPTRDTLLDSEGRKLPITWTASPVHDEYGRAQTVIMAVDLRDWERAENAEREARELSVLAKRLEIELASYQRLQLADASQELVPNRFEHRRKPTRDDGRVGLTASMLADAVKEFQLLLQKLVEEKGFQSGNDSRIEIRQFSQRLCERWATARDVVEMYSSALNSSAKTAPPRAKRLFVDEGRLLLVEILGNLASQYREQSRLHVERTAQLEQHASSQSGSRVRNG